MTTETTEEGADWSPPSEVQLAGQLVRFGRPRSISIIYEIAGACGQPGAPGVRGLAAALGVAWLAGATLHAPKARYDRCGYDPLRYGGEVLDELLERGVGYADVAHAGRAAWLYLTADLVTESEVAAAEGNSEAGARSTA